MLLKDVAPAAWRALVPQVDIAAGNRIDVGHCSLLRFSPDGSADRLSRVGAPQSITSEVKDFDFGDQWFDTGLYRRTRPTWLAKERFGRYPPERWDNRPAQPRRDFLAGAASAVVLRPVA